MQKNKVILEQNRTIIKDRKSQQSNAKRINGSVLDEMQAVFDSVENHSGNRMVDSQSVQAQGLNQSNANFLNQPLNNNTGPLNNGMLTTLLPLLKNMGGKNVGGLTNVLNSIPTMQNGDNSNLLTQLLPLLANTKTTSKKTQSEKPSELKIDTLTKAE